jgi:peptidyl-prolyl cis-trans isomerase D
VHLIRLDEVRAIEYPALDQVKAEIETRLRADQANQLFDERKRELDNLAFERPDDLVETGKMLGLEVQRERGRSPPHWCEMPSLQTMCSTRG